MGASKLELDSLAEDGVLTPRTAIPTVNSLWHPADGLKLVTELQAKAVMIDAHDESWERIQHAKYRTGRSVGAIINAIRDGSLLSGHRPDVNGYQATHVKADEIDLLANRSGLFLDPDVIPMSSFGRSIGLPTTKHLVALVSAGHTPATRMKFRKSGRERFCMTKADIAAFHRRFVSLSKLVSEAGEHWNTILVRLKNSSVHPFSPGGEEYGHLYLRDDVEQAFPRMGK